MGKKRLGNKFFKIIEEIKKTYQKQRNNTQRHDKTLNRTHYSKISVTSNRANFILDLTVLHKYKFLFGLFPSIIYSNSKYCFTLSNYSNEYLIVISKHSTVWAIHISV